MNKLGLFVLSLILVFSLSLKANQCVFYYILDTDSISKNVDTYCKDFCSENVVRLGQQLQTAGLSTDSLNVIILQSENARRPIVPIRMDSGVISPFTFHVILEYKDSILDYDSAFKGKPQPISSYFSKHFPLLNEQSVTVQRLSFADYLKLKEKNNKKFIHFARSLPKYQFGSLQSYLAYKNVIISEKDPISKIIGLRARWTYFTKSAVHSEVVRNYIVFKGIGNAASLPVFDENLNSYKTIKGQIISIHDRLVIIKQSDGVEVPIPYSLVDESEFSFSSLY